jgi:predicted transcriptional regulator
LVARDARTGKRDEILAELMTKAGMSKNLSKALIFIARRNETTSVEIEKATGLRQPEVSIAMQELRQRRWVEKKDIKKEGKGRPVHSYRLSVPFPEIVDTICGREAERIKQIEENLKRLRQLA